MPAHPSSLTAGHSGGQGTRDMGQLGPDPSPLLFLELGGHSGVASSSPQSPTERGGPALHPQAAGPDSLIPLTAASSFSKPKVLTAGSTLKFIPEELAIFCRDFRLLRFCFPENGLAPQAFRVSQGGAQGLYPPSELPRGSGESWGGRVREEGSSTVLLFESLRDWEKELQRLGAAGWRVSAVNERFDMAPSLPQYLWVPSGLLDHDLKRTFAHFQERRVPRLCWHLLDGGDLLRAASFHVASEPGSEDVRCLEALLLGGRGPCVLADTAELPTLADIQLAHLRLRALCLPGAAAEEKWLSALEGTRWLDHVRTCLRKAVEVVSLLAGKRCSVVLQEPSDRDLNCLVASLVQLLGDPHARSLPGFQSLVQREWVAAGHPFPRRLGLLCRDSPRDEAPVFLLFLDCTWQLLRQFPAHFGFTEAFLLALHDSSFSPYFSTFRFSCQRQRGHGSSVRGRGTLPGDPPICTLPSVWAWGLRYTRQQRQRFRNPAGPPGPAEPWAPGRVSVAGLGVLHLSFTLFVLLTAFSSVFSSSYCFPRHSLFIPFIPQCLIFCPTFPPSFPYTTDFFSFFFPYPYSSPSLALRVSPIVLIPVFPFPSLESPARGGRPGRCWRWPRAPCAPSPCPGGTALPCSPRSGCPLQNAGTQGGLLGLSAPPGLLLPAPPGPCVQLWHRCYLRGLPQEQVLGN
uniref:Myotubularin related protein 11 n=1 Tax=Malurus cyaneus samueli TaxID=2593467 RepID=A0A8C5TJC3_9PASS